MAWLAETQKRIAAYDHAGPALNAVLEWNPEAGGIAAALEWEYSQKGRRSSLHGVPVLLKDNIGTADGMHTSAGTLALADRFAPRDSFVASRLWAAGAVLCGKSNMTELANFMTDSMPNGYSSRGGQVLHAWKEGSDPSGSSTGSAVAVAAGYVRLAIGTETCGSIISPAGEAGIVGLKPTVGWVSRSGILPIAPSQDTAGPMARTVADCALAFSILAGYDADDASTGLGAGRAVPGIDCCGVRPEGLKGIRLGLYPLDGEDKPIKQEAFFTAVKHLKSLGAEIIPYSPPAGSGRHMMAVLTHEFRMAMDAALRSDAGSMRTLAAIAAYNEAHAVECLKYGQTNILAALALPRPMLTAEYVEARRTAQDALLALEKSFGEMELDAVVSMSGLMAFPVTGCPALTLPVGIDCGLPVPITLNGLPFSEGKLLAIGSALETAIGGDFRPPFLV
jgi:amidase